MRSFIYIVAAYHVILSGFACSVRDRDVESPGLDKRVGAVLHVERAIALARERIVQLGRRPEDYFVRECRDEDGRWAIHFERRAQT